MTAYTVTFPLRTIQLQMQDKAQKDIEQQGLLNYGELHDELWALKTYWQTCRDKVKEQENTLQNCETSYAAMETEAKRYGKLGGYPEILLGEDEEPIEYTLKLKDLQALIDECKAWVDQFNNGSTVLVEMYEKGLDMNEALEKSFGHFQKNYFLPILYDYDGVQVDTVSFDNDLEEFRICWQAVSAMADTFYDEWHALNPPADELHNKMVAINYHLRLVIQGYDVANAANYDNLNAALN